jgi:hypothetical protein
MRLLVLGVPLAVLLIAAAAALAAEPGSAGAPPASSRFVVAEYMRAVPAGPTAVRCKRVCVKSKSEGNRGAPMCLQWRTVC